MSEFEDPIDYYAFTSTKDENDDLLDVVVLNRGNWIAALATLRQQVIGMYQTAQGRGERVDHGSIDRLSVLSQSQRTFVFNAYGYYVGICTGGQAMADAMVQREITLNEQRIHLAEVLVHALNVSNFQPGREIGVDDIDVSRDQIIIKRRFDHPPFIEAPPVSDE